MSIDSSLNMLAHHVTAPGTLSRSKPSRVFQTDLFETYVARLARKHVAQQFVEPDHPVLVDEQRMIDASSASLREHLSESVPEWRMAWRLAKMIVIHHVRHLAEQRLALHDVEDDVREQAIESIFKEDFEELFPPTWLDG